MALSPKRSRMLLWTFAGLAAVAFPVIAILRFDPWLIPIDKPLEGQVPAFFTVAETLIPSPPAVLLGNEVKREETDGTLSFTWRDSKARWRRSKTDRIPPRYQSNEKQMVSLPGGGEIRLAWAVMGYQPDLTKFPAKDPFTPTKAIVRGDTWKLLNETAFQKYQSEELGIESRITPRLSAWSAGIFSLDLHFLHKGLPDMRPVDELELMNLSTLSEVDMSSGFSLNSFREGHYYANPAISIFYPARLAAGFDLGYGPVEEARLPAEPGAQASVSDVAIRIVSIERFSRSMAMRSSVVKREKNRETRATTFRIDPKFDPMTSVIFSLSPPELGRFCDIVLVDKTGEEKVIQLRGATRIDYVSTKTPVEELSEVVLRYRPNHARVVFHLPPLRGVPEVNRGITNLFDLTIPHLKVREDWDLLRAISQQTGARYQFRDAEFPEDYFPRHYENRTARSLMEEYLSHHPDGERIQLDRDTYTVTIPQPLSWKDLINKYTKR